MPINVFMLRKHSCYTGIVKCDTFLIFTETYVEKQHNLGEYPGLVIVRLISPDNVLILNAVGKLYSKTLFTHTQH